MTFAPLDEIREVTEAATMIADAIERRDVDAIARSLAPGFVHRTPGEPSRDAEAFLDAIRQIPGEIVFVKLVDLTADLVKDGAIVVGIQHAQVRIDGNVIDDRRAFVDLFVKHQGEWQIRLAVDLPASDDPTEAADPG